MHRFYLPPEETKGRDLFLKDREAHHASQVLRIEKGEKVAVLNGVGTEFLCEVQSAQKKQIHLSVLTQQEFPRSATRLTLLQAIPRGKIIESIIQKATELGISRVVPLLTARVITHLDEEGAEGKQEKWQQVAIEAMKQCGQPWFPVVEKPMTPEDWSRREEPSELALIGSLQPGAKHASLYFNAFRESHRREPASVDAWIGPEGDFTVEEIQWAVSRGALPITLGRWVLRTETAAVAVLSMINYELSRPSPNFS